MKYTKVDWWLPKLLCLIAAFAFWVYVMDEQNPQVENAYSVPIEVRNLDKSLVATNVPKNVRVTVRMTRSEMINMRSEDLKAYVDLSDLKAGDYPNTPIHVTVPNDETVISQTPAYIDLVIDTYAVKSLPAKVVLNGGDNTYTATLDKVVPDTIAVAGAASFVNQVDRAVISVNVADKQKSFSEYDSVNVLDADGNSVQNVNIMPSMVQVSVNVKEALRTRALPLHPDAKGTPADGYEPGEITVTPSIISVTAPQSFFDTNREIKLDPVDITGASSPVTQTVNIPAPDGGSVAPQTATVTVEVSPKS